MISRHNIVLFFTLGEEGRFFFFFFFFFFFLARDFMPLIFRRWGAEELSLFWKAIGSFL